MVCSHCKSQYHLQKKCSDMGRQEIKVLDRTTWKCPVCVEKEIAEEDIQSVTEKESNYHTGKSKVQDLKILQLNIDAISSKKNELKMFLQREKVDIFCIQETKMIKKDEDKMGRNGPEKKMCLRLASTTTRDKFI